MKVRISNSGAHRLLPQIEAKDASSMKSSELEAARTAETRFLRMLWSSDRRSELATRVVIDQVLGWRIGELASMIGVSRVTLNRLLDDYEGDYDLTTALRNQKALDFRADFDKLTQIGMRIGSDRFVVPPEMAKTLAALWRMAYRARGSAAAGSELKLSCVSDALDIWISILLRRGCTFLAISQAAGVSHRAVLDRMNRARMRGDIFADHETFFGDREISSISRSFDHDYWDEATSGLFVLVRTQPDVTLSSRSWLKVMKHHGGDFDGEPVVFHGGDDSDSPEPDPMLSYLLKDGIIEKRAFEDALRSKQLSSQVLSEFRTALLLSTHTKERTMASRARGPKPALNVIPVEHYYGESAVDSLADLRKISIPPALYNRFFRDCAEAMVAVETPDLVLEEYPEIPRRPRKAKAL